MGMHEWTLCVIPIIAACLQNKSFIVVNVKSKLH